MKEKILRKEIVRIKATKNGVEEFNRSERRSRSIRGQFFQSKWPVVLKMSQYDHWSVTHLVLKLVREMRSKGGGKSGKAWLTVRRPDKKGEKDVENEAGKRVRCRGK